MRINMSYRENAAIISTACLADGVYEMWLKTEKIAKEARPGQFISVYSNDGSRLQALQKVYDQDNFCWRG